MSLRDTVVVLRLTDQHVLRAFHVYTFGDACLVAAIHYGLLASRSKGDDDR